MTSPAQESRKSGWPRGFKCPFGEPGGASCTDWSRNSKLWKGRAVVNGRITKSINNVKLTVSQIKMQIGMKLTTDELEREKEFKANA